MLATKPLQTCPGPKGCETVPFRNPVHKDTLVVSDDLAIKAKRVGQRKPFLEQKPFCKILKANPSRR